MAKENDTSRYVLAQLHGPTFEHRLHGLMLIGLQPNPERFIDEVIPLLKYPGPYVSAAAVGALKEIGNRRARAYVARALRDPRPFVRFRAAQCMTELGDRRGLPVLVGFLRQGPIKDYNGNEAGTSIRDGAATGVREYIRRHGIGELRMIEPKLAIIFSHFDPDEHLTVMASAIKGTDHERFESANARLFLKQLRGTAHHIKTG